jgi:hypothetical protein
MKIKINKKAAANKNNICQPQQKLHPSLLRDVGSN